MIELKLLLTDDEVKVLEGAILSYAARLERISKEKPSPMHNDELHTLHLVTAKYLAAVA